MLETNLIVKLAWCGVFFRFRLVLCTLKTRKKTKHTDSTIKVSTPLKKKKLQISSSLVKLALEGHLVLPSFFPCTLIIHLWKERGENHSHKSIHGLFLHVLSHLFIYNTLYNTHIKRFKNCEKTHTDTDTSAVLCAKEKYKILLKSD